MTPSQPSRVYAVSYISTFYSVEYHVHVMGGYVRRWTRRHPQQQLILLPLIVEPERWTEDGYPARDRELMDRPGWHRVLQLIQRKKEPVRCLFVYRPSELSHNILEQECAMADLKMRGVSLITKEVGHRSVYEPDYKERVLIRECLDFWVSYQKFILARRLRESRNRSKEATGKHEGKKPFGFYPGESEVVEHIKALRADGLGVDRIAARLNTENIKPRSGKLWHGSVVNGILGRDNHIA